MLKTPCLPCVHVGLPGNHAFRVGTPGIDSHGYCIQRIGLGKGICSGVCVARTSLLTKKALRFSVTTSPGGGEKLTGRTGPCSVSRR